MMGVGGMGGGMGMGMVGGKLVEGGGGEGDVIGVVGSELFMVMGVVDGMGMMGVGVGV